MNILCASLFTRYFGILAVLLNILNVLDTFLTIHWVTNGIAEEANPLMDYLIELSPLLFAVTKIALVGMGSFLLYRYKESRASWVALGCCLFVYTWIMVIHYQIGADNLSFPSHNALIPGQTYISTSVACLAS